MARSGTSIFVVSDLHIGGKEGFRMCEEKGRARLAALFRFIGRRAETRNVRIVIAGDIVDFLAEEPFAAFTMNEDEATVKLKRILNASSDVWKALSEAAGRGVAITLMLGNHDVELSMPRPRRALLDRIQGSVEFLCDNEAFSFGALLVEHGNRYDGGNAVDHDGLRQLRSRSSRGEAQAAFSTQPGSELVARVMNQFKQKYPWVDLLKPETAGVIPILAALGGSTWQIAANSAKAAAGAAWRTVQVGTGGTPRANNFVSAAETRAVAPVALTEPLPVDDLEAVFELFDSLPKKPEEKPKESRMVAQGAVTIDEELLFRGLRHWGEKDNRTFKIDLEKDVYLKAANAIAKRNEYKVIVFGHTHHVKKIALENGATYLNTGTWADLMRIPEVILKGDDESVARDAFGTFITQLKTDAGELRRLLPSYARIDFDDAENLVSKDVLFFDENDESVSVTTNEVLRRLA